MEAKTELRTSVPLPLAGTGNTRDLGGYPAGDGQITTFGRFYRSDALGRLTQADRDELLRRGLGCVVDLRSDAEVQASPPALGGAQGVDYHHFPLMDGAASQNFGGVLPESMTQVYRALLSDSGRTFAAVMDTLAQYSDKACLFHCTAGKDRTGLVAMFLLSLAGVPRAYILADYAVSRRNMEAVFTRQRREIREQTGVELPDALFSSDPEHMEAAMDYLEEHDGSPRDYLLRRGAKEESLNALRRRLLAP